VIGDKRRELLSLSGFDHQELAHFLKYDSASHNKTILTAIMKPVEYFQDRKESWFPKCLKWCPECLKGGYHSWLHQFIMIQRCPEHEISLLDKCPGCSEHIPFLISDSMLDGPFTCKCGYRLANFSQSLWAEWGVKIQIKDRSVLNWLAMGQYEDVSRWLFIPKRSSVDLFTFEPAIKSKVFCGANRNTGSEYYFKSRFKDDIYIQNMETFRATDRYIRKKILPKHHICIQTHYTHWT